MSDDELVKRISENDDLKQSVILVCNYFEHVRFSIVNKRIDREQFKDVLGSVVVGIIDRFNPYFKSLGQEHVDDFNQLKDLLSGDVSARESPFLSDRC